MTYSIKIYLTEMVFKVELLIDSIQKFSTVWIELSLVKSL